MSRMTRLDIINKIDLWHTGISKLPIHEFIGMTRDEYVNYLNTGKIP